MSSYIERRWQEIEKWENTHFTYDATDLEVTSHRALEKGFYNLPESQRRRALMFVDKFLFYAQSLTLNSKYHDEAEDRLIRMGQVFDDEIQSIEDFHQLQLPQLNYLLSTQLAKQRLVSLGQGGATGFGGPLLLASDLPMLLLINLRTVQLTAMTYGYDLRYPNEMMTALQVFHTASLPKRMQKAYWDQLPLHQDENGSSPYFYDGEEEVVDATWLLQPLRHIAKAVVLQNFRKKLLQGVPVLGIAFGAAVNYQFAREVSEVAKRYYEKRWIIEHTNGE
ncbi:EcsC family protein [Salsuginibacillus halophilus]|uniref:EcsC family protein n=1 Tax=Salsuginibacillus halophilus TaxID=517424 RepID=A0A2P8HEA5_9BACI|nr:EcsC family protein [Salsuginibacillus halophilus]PSL44568.1 EcsC family protein [Salsuginibacillus halophilus]